MLIAFALFAALASPAASSANADRTAIAHAVMQRHSGEQVTAVFVHGNYALATGHTASGPVNDGLHLAQGRWHIACTLSSEPIPTKLRSQCGFPQAVAIEVSANEATQRAAEQGQFGLATIAQARAYNWSVKGPERDDERARLQLLHQLSEQMRTGMISRQQAIQKWNEFKLTWALP